MTAFLCSPESVSDWLCLAHLPDREPITVFVVMRVLIEQIGSHDWACETPPLRPTRGGGFRKKSKELFPRGENIAIDSGSERTLTQRQRVHPARLSLTGFAILFDFSNRGLYEETLN